MGTYWTSHGISMEEKGDILAITHHAGGREEKQIGHYMAHR